MTAQIVTAFEHQRLDVASTRTPVAVDDLEATALEEVDLRLDRFCERGHRSVRLGAYCGVVSLGERLLEILPKVEESSTIAGARGLLLNLLRRSRSTPGHRQRTASQRLEPAPLIDAFINAFFDEVARVVRGGLLRQYQPLHEDLQAVRGRIQSSRQFGTLANRQDVIACSYDDLTADNDWNQFIKAGLRSVRKFIGSAYTMRRWTDLMIAFDEVAAMRMTPESHRALTVDRRTLRYRAAAEWSRRILALASPSLRGGDADAPGLVFDVNRLWESTVAAELRLRLTGSQHVETQVTGRYLASVQDSAHRTVGLRPDLVVFANDRAVLIADTKWKRLEIGRGGFLRPAPDDVYQMHAYSATFDCPDLALIYPWHEGLAGSRETVLELPGVGMIQPRIRLVCIDLADGRFQVIRGAESLKWQQFVA